MMRLNNINQKINHVQKTLDIQILKLIWKLAYAYKSLFFQILDPTRLTWYLVFHRKVINEEDK